jgi:hypothetical protein
MNDKEWIDSWMRVKIPATARYAGKVAKRRDEKMRKRTSDKPPAMAPWQEVVKWLSDRASNITPDRP